MKEKEMGKRVRELNKEQGSSNDLVTLYETDMRNDRKKKLKVG